MRPQGVGVAESSDAHYLQYDWHRHLTPKQLEAYIRYLFIALKENAYDPDTPAHTTKKTKWDGGRDSFGTNCKNIWSEIARQVRAAEAVPGTWVAAHFSPTFHAVRIAENKGFVGERPELLCGKKLSIDIYHQYCDRFKDITNERCAAAEISIATHLKMLESVIKDSDDLILYVVADKTNVNATPFFRHAFAAFANCQRAVKKYIVQAAVEYDMNQEMYDELATHHDNTWWLSDELKDVVARNRKQWSRYHG
jgi:hypothetical protein